MLKGLEALLMRESHPTWAASPPSDRNLMAQKTNFSFEVQYLAQSGVGPEQRDEVMAGLGPALQKMLAAEDPGATVSVSDSHKGSSHKIVELVCSLQDAQIARVLKTFSEQHGVSISALE